jgi:hypothetical protein
MNIEIAPKEYERKLNWNDGKLYCSLFGIDGKDDWRLPTKDEMFEIFKHSNDYKPHVRYWTDTTDRKDWMFYVEFTVIFCSGVSNIDIPYFIRPIRTI